MKLQDIRFAGERLVEAYGDGGFRLTDGRVEGSILILPWAVQPFHCDRFESVAEQMFEPVFEKRSEVEIFLFGTGARLQFPTMGLRKRFIEANIALEVMDTGAACRTYNVLVSESRRVAAALIAV